MIQLTSETNTSFAFDAHEIRIVMRDNEPWFVLKDVCDALKMTSNSATTKVADRLDDDQKGIAQMDTLLYGTQQMTIVSESGLYEVVMRSDKPEAKKFRRWVTGEVLPQIRKNGSYALSAEPRKVKLTPAMLRAIADSVDWVEVAAPKVAAHDKMLEVDGGWYVATVARMFGMGPRQLQETMRNWGATYRNTSGTSRAGDAWVQRGWLKKRGIGTPVVTPDGLKEIERRLGKTAFDPDTSVPVLSFDFVASEIDAVDRLQPVDSQLEGGASDTSPLPGK